MKTLYLDIFSGISGDMLLGALIDLGVDLHHIEDELAKLNLEGYHIHAARRQKGSIQGVKFDVHLARGHEEHGDPDHDHDHEDPHHPHGHLHPEHNEDSGDPHLHDHDHEHSHHHGHGHDHEHDEEHHAHGHPHAHEHVHEHADHDAHGRDFAEIKRLIAHSGLSDWVKQKSIAVFQRIAVAEGKIHGHPPDRVHFHEVGAIDSIVDIVGACVALEVLGKPRVLAAPAVEGTGWVNCAHGRFPVPTMATLEILGARGIAVSQCDEPHELITPTGAAFLAEFAESFAPMQGLVATKVAYGLGTRDNKTRPNVLRAILGDVSATATASAPPNDWETDTIAVLETNLDDCQPEVLGSFVELALGAGALDVFHTPIQMKKNRPGVLLTILCEAESADRFTELLLRETSAFGVRRSLAERRKLRREIKAIQTPYGEVSVKFGKLNGAIVHATPEFESCRKLAAQAKVPLKRVYEAVTQSLNI